MRKNRIRLSESQLHRVIKESVRQMLSEVDWNKPKWQYSLGALAGRKHNQGLQNGNDDAEEYIEDFARKHNGGNDSDFYRGRFDFEDTVSDRLHNLVNTDPIIKMEWEGDDDDDIYQDSVFTDDDWIKGDKLAHEDFSQRGYDLKGAMKKRGLSESRLHNVIKESVKRVLSHPRRGY